MNDTGLALLYVWLAVGPSVLFLAFFLFLRWLQRWAKLPPPEP